MRRADRLWGDVRVGVIYRDAYGVRVRVRVRVRRAGRLEGAVRTHRAWLGLGLGSGPGLGSGLGLASGFGRGRGLGSGSGPRVTGVLRERPALGGPALDEGVRLLLAEEGVELQDPRVRGEHARLEVRERRAARQPEGLVHRARGDRERHLGRVGLIFGLGLGLGSGLGLGLGLGFRVRVRAWI